MKQLRRGDGWWALRDILLALEPFQNSTKQFRGVDTRCDSAPPSVGRMPEPFSTQLRRKYSIHRIDYIIYSYYTPIAYLAGGEWIIPDVTYSKTTTAHQGLVRTAIDQLPASVR